jgi:hypothetical protein
MKRLVLFALVLAAFATVASAQTPSSFQLTCSDYIVVASGGSAVLQANCVNSAGSGSPSSLVLKGIGNSNGKLVAGGSGPATFQQSCGSITVIGNAAGATLSALCRTTSGSFVASRIALTGIRNNNGTLSY